MFDEKVEQNLELDNQVQENQVAEEQNEQESESRAKQSFRELRTKLQKTQQERDELFNHIKNIEAKNKSNISSNDIYDEDFNLDPDAIAEGKHLHKVNNEVKNLKKQLQEMKRFSEETQAENKLKSKYSDFDQVVSEDNIEMLKESHPDLWNTIASAPNLYNRGLSAYMFIKSLSPNQVSYEEDKVSIQKNMAKPRSMTSVSPQKGNTPLSQANVFEKGLNPQLQKQLWKEMQDATGNK